MEQSHQRRPQTTVNREVIDPSIGRSAAQTPSQTTSMTLSKPTQRKRRVLIPGLMFGLLFAITGCGGSPSSSPNGQGASQSSQSPSGNSAGTAGGMKKIRIPMASDGPKSLDPIRGSTVYENQCSSQIIETLLQYKYLKRPFELEPLLLAQMPTSEDGLTWHFQLKPDVYFQDDACFPEGKGRKVVSSDVFYSWKRMADLKANSKVWWLIKDTIKGFDAYRDAQNEASRFNYDADVEGLKVINDQEFTVTLNQPSPLFLWKLAMFQMGIVPREAVEKYGERFGLHPVGTGPFILKDESDWTQGVGIRFTKNPNYHECTYPTEFGDDDKAEGFDRSAGQKLPIVDEVEVVFFKTVQPLWLEFKSGKLDYVRVPSEYFAEAFNKRTLKLTREMEKEGMRGYPIPLLDFIFRGFNMEDKLIGGNGDKAKYIRQAICLATDWEEQNDAFYNGINQIYDGVIPPGLPGHPEGGKSDKAYRGKNLEKARELLAKAGYPGGKGLPTIDYYSSIESNGQELAEMTQRQLGEIGINLKVNLMGFSQLMQKVDEKSAQMFSFAWGSDYPDGENNLALFYGPNEAPGANHFNYKNAEFDKLYEEIVRMMPSDERIEKMIRMQEIVMEDCPYAGSMARTRFYVVTPRLKNFKPVETFENWFKYLDVADQ
ncbi:MAG: hypothetical protein KDA81_09430 [Planctomycetaceae bacterium]|nr:hypothetical protein [Planctomycetaceae bacterium]